MFSETAGLEIPAVCCIVTLPYFCFHFALGPKLESLNDLTVNDLTINDLTV
jgi:hypothetical protein